MRQQSSKLTISPSHYFTTVLLYNGQLLPETDFALPLPNRGLQFNDGFFETMIWADGGVRYLSHHVHRMQAAAAVLQLPLPPTLATAATLTQTVGQLVAAQPLLQARVRVQLWRGGGGLYSPEPGAPTEFVATAQPFQPNNAPVLQTDFARSIQSVFSPFSFCKGPHALYYVRAAQERQQRGLDELLLLDAAGHVAESVSAAVFWVQAGRLYTPALTTGCVAGVRRAHVLRVAQHHGLLCTEGLFAPAELLAAEAVFTANVAGIRELRNVGSTVLPTGPHPLVAALRAWEAAYSAEGSAT